MAETGFEPESVSSDLSSQPLSTEAVSSEPCNAWAKLCVFKTYAQQNSHCRHQLSSLRLRGRRELKIIYRRPQEALYVFFCTPSAVTDLKSWFCVALADISNLTSGPWILSDQRQTKEAQRRCGKVWGSQPEDNYLKGASAKTGLKEVSHCSEKKEIK